MADEARIISSLQIQKRATDGTIILDYLSRPGAFTADVAGTKGPVPGAIKVSRNGTTVTFSELTTPGLCRLMNLDSTYMVEWGVWNPQNTEFYPVGEILPGESYVFRLSRNLREEYTSPGTGTGTGAAGSAEFRLKAEWAAGTGGVNVAIEAFEA